MDEEVNHGFWSRSPWHTRFCRAFWRWLGYTYHALPEIPGDLGEAAALFSSMHTVVYIGFVDRLRLLLSGRLKLDYRIRTDVPVRELHAESVLSILSPGYDK